MKNPHWVEFHCPDHGFLVETSVRAVVTCKCRKRAFEYLDGKRLHRQERQRMVKACKAST